MPSRPHSVNSSSVNLIYWTLNVSGPYHLWQQHTPFAWRQTRISRWCSDFRQSFVGAFANLRKTTISFVMSDHLSVCLSAWNNSPPTGRVFIKFDIWAFFSKIYRLNTSFIKTLVRISGPLYEDQYKFMIISLSFLLRVRNVPDEVVKKCKHTFYVQ
jgi:hypothetical protein